jgi:hypothetical protein
MTPKFTRGGYHRNGGTLLAPDLRRELGKVPGQVLRRNPHGGDPCYDVADIWEILLPQLMSKH